MDAGEAPSRLLHGARHGVNLNNFDPQLAAAVKVRHFDGADSWTFLD